MKDIYKYILELLSHFVVNMLQYVKIKAALLETNIGDEWSNRPTAGRCSSHVINL